MSTARRYRVALLIETSTSWGAGIVEGIAEFSQSADWTCLWDPRGKLEKLSLPDAWEVDGVIARVTHQELADQIEARGVPAVNVSWYRYGGSRIVRCTGDETEAARLAAAHLADKGYQNFAYCGAPERAGYVDRFGAAFEFALNQRGFQCAWFCRDEVAAPPRLAEQESALAAWLEALPKPCGLLTFHSVQGRRVIDACQTASIDVPNEVAILAGEHDDLSVEFARPKLTSIDSSVRRIGWEAAAVLSEMLEGGPPPTKPRLIPPAGITERQSTSSVAIADKLISLAVSYIRENACRGILVSDVLKHVPLSRRTLEKGFQRHFSRTPAEEIRRVRVARAAQLLKDTNWPAQKVAMESGFDSAEVLIRSFRRRHGMTPAQYRKRHRI